MLSEEFHRPPGRYFLSHSVGLQPKGARAAVEDFFLSPWAEGCADVWERWLGAIDSFRRELAPVIDADPSDICPQTNISSGLSKALFSLPVARGRTKIVLSEDDFPTVGFVLQQGRRLELEIVYLEGGARLADPDAWSAAFREDVHLVHVTHVFSNLGLKSPVSEIVARARAMGVATCVDVGQSAGAVPVSARAWGADFLTGTSVKYLCGGPGACFLWVNPATAPRCRPLDVGWFSHQRPFEFDIKRFEYAEGATRFWGGTPSIAPFAAAAAGARIIARAGVEAIHRHCQNLFDRLIASLPRGAIASHATAGERGSSFLVQVRDAEAALGALADARIVHDRRQGHLRFSFHLYNDESDADALAQALRPLI
jgi:selenocysteine lyase/cysteine desulfurase